MAVKSFRPLTPSSRYVTIASFDEITKTTPEKSLVKIRKKTGGRNMYGRVTARARGGGHKQKIRQVDFRRQRHGVPATVVAIEYDPIRTARIALVEYKDGEKSYILAPNGLQVGAKLLSGTMAAPEIGNSLPLKNIPPATTIHNLEIVPGKGAQMVRSAGVGAVVMAVDEGYAQVKLPSGEIRRFHEDCYATVGQVGNTEHENIILGKAGRNRHLGRRPMSRGMARNPHDHPNGGGQGKSKGGGGRQHLMSPWGLLAKGKRTRKKYKLSNRFILVRRDGRPMKNK
jgi:large subunit ribosomal protein L2